MVTATKTQQTSLSLRLFASQSRPDFNNSHWRLTSKSSPSRDQSLPSNLYLYKYIHIYIHISSSYWSYCDYQRLVCYPRYLHLSTVQFLFCPYFKASMSCASRRSFTPAARWAAALFAASSAAGAQPTKLMALSSSTWKGNRILTPNEPKICKMKPKPVGGWTNPSEKICASQGGWSPQVGVKMKNVWNHHLACGHCTYEIQDVRNNQSWITPTVPVHQRATPNPTASEVAWNTAPQKPGSTSTKWGIGKMKRPESGLSLEASLLVFRLRFAKLLIILSIIVVQSP